MSQLLDVKGAEYLLAVVNPSNAAVDGMKNASHHMCRIQVPDFERGGKYIRRTDDDPVIGTGGQGQSRNASDGNNAAAAPEEVAAGTVGKRGQQRCRQTAVVRPNTDIERIDTADVAYRDINL